MSEIINEFEEGIRLPPMISSNYRNKIVAAKIPIDDIKLEYVQKDDRIKQQVYAEPFPTPKPKHPLIISWTPDLLNFTLFEETITAKLGVCNRSSRPIYMQCCGLWDETSRLGASWLAFPRTRVWLSPGLNVDLYIQAAPRPYTPIKSSCSSLQIAATHLRDNVTGYFMVPIKVSFLKYVPPSVCEGE